MHRAGLVFTLLATCLAVPRIILAAPVIDGNLDDMISYAQSVESSELGCGAIVTDNPDAGGNPQPETVYLDEKFIPCVTPAPLGSHWTNGKEIFWHVFAYVRGSSMLHLGIRSEGMIGDTDGNGDPDTIGGAACNAYDNIEDAIGIGARDTYAWSFDLDLDGTPDGQIFVSNNAVSGSGTLSGTTGTFAFRQNAGAGASGKDLEVEVNLPAPLPTSFRLLRLSSNMYDGTSEDESIGFVCSDSGIPASRMSWGRVKGMYR
jgi:hypothetical protein